MSTGSEGLDRLLGGGLLPGTLAVVVGASGIGKTQLGLQYAQAGSEREGRRGIIFDLNARIDPQSHHDYAARMFGWQLAPADPLALASPDAVLDLQRPLGDYLHVFDVQGRHVARGDVDFDTWHDWQAQLAAKLQAAIAFFYGNFVRGARRAVIDGIEPVDRPSDSIQFELFHYVYHQIVRKDHDWVARDLLREQFRSREAEVRERAYDFRQVGCLLLYTAHESMLEALIQRPLDQGDILATANTLIYMGKIREGRKLARALYVSKHRGSACVDEIVPYQIVERGLEF